MKRRTGKKMKPKARKPTRRRPAADALELQRLRQRYPQAFAFEDELAKIEKQYGVDPKGVRKILVSPWEPLGAWRDLQEERDGWKKRLESSFGGAQETLEANIAAVEKAMGVAARKAGLGFGQRFGKRMKEPPEWFWHNAPADMPDGPWLNPHRWPWLRERAARLADYLAPYLANPKRSWRKGTARNEFGKPVRLGTGRHSQPVYEKTAQLVQLFYRTFYFPALTFTAHDALQAVKHFYRSTTASR